MVRGNIDPVSLVSLVEIDDSVVDLIYPVMSDLEEHRVGSKLDLVVPIIPSAARTLAFDWDWVFAILPIFKNVDPTAKS